MQTSLILPRTSNQPIFFQVIWRELLWAVTSARKRSNTLIVYLLRKFHSRAHNPWLVVTPHMRILPHTRMGWPVCIQNIPYVYGLLTCSIHVWESHTHMGAHTVYGWPICVWGKAYFLTLFLRNAVDRLSRSGVQYQVQLIFIQHRKIIFVMGNQNLLTVTLTPFPCSDNLNQGLALNVWQQPRVYRGGSKWFRKPFLILLMSDSDTLIDQSPTPKK